MSELSQILVKEARKRGIDLYREKYERYKADADVLQKQLQPSFWQRLSLMANKLGWGGSGSPAIEDYTASVRGRLNNYIRNGPNGKGPGFFGMSAMDRARRMRGAYNYMLANRGKYGPVVNGVLSDPNAYKRFQSMPGQVDKERWNTVKNWWEGNKSWALPVGIGALGLTALTAFGGMGGRAYAQPPAGAAQAQPRVGQPQAPWWDARRWGAYNYKGPVAGRSQWSG